jgi:hypothetical protein
MRKHKIKIDNIDFVEGTARHKIYGLFKEGKTPEEISSLTNAPIKSVKWYIYKFRQITGRVFTEPVEQVLEEQVGPIGSVVTPTVTQRLVLEIKQENNELMLFVKTSPEFEDWVKEHRQKMNTRNLFGRGESGDYYQMKIIDNYLDDINTPIIYGGRINFAILRVVGVKDGLKFKIDGLLTEIQIKKALKLMILTYKKFFRMNIENHQINFRAEVLEEL